MFYGLVCRAVVCGDGDGKRRELVVWGVGVWGPIPACAGMTKKQIFTGLPRLRLAMTRVIKS